MVFEGSGGHALDAATRAIDRDGPGGLTLAAVAAEAGLSPATLVQRFGPNQLAFLQIDLSDPEFHALALAHAVAVRDEIAETLDGAVRAGELAPQDTARLARAVQTTYNGALVTWAIHRTGRLDTWLRQELDALLAPRRPLH